MSSLPYADTFPQTRPWPRAETYGACLRSSWTSESPVGSLRERGAWMRLPPTTPVTSTEIASHKASSPIAELSTPFRTTSLWTGQFLLKSAAGRRTVHEPPAKFPPLVVTRAGAWLRAAACTRCLIRSPTLHVLDCSLADLTSRLLLYRHARL